MVRYLSRKKSIRSGLMLSALLLSSCSYPGVKEPLSDPDTSKPDAGLYGVWRLQEKDPTKRLPIFFFIGRSGQPGAPLGIMKSVVVGIDADNEVSREKPLYFFTAPVANKPYLHLFDGCVFDRAEFPKWDQTNIKEYSLFRYKLEADKLTVWPIDKDAVETAIRKGQVEGTIVEVKNQKTITLKGGENLVKFLSGEGEKVFFPQKDGMVWTREK